MKLGFLTACLPRLHLPEIAAWAAAAGYDALEVAAWPAEEAGDGTACHLDVQNLDQAAAATTQAMLDRHGLTISAVSYYANNLHPDQQHREQIHAHLQACIDAAARFGVPHVGTFVGRDPTRTVRENFALAESILPALVDYADTRGIRLVIENCPMEGWHPDGYPGNLAYSPELWDWLTTLGLYLNYDPSHLLWLGIDPIEALHGHADRVLHVQAKDTQLLPEARTRYSIYGKTSDRTDPFDAGWWRYRVPGLGDLDWRRIIDALYEHGYQGTVAVEHEDTIWAGTDDRIKHGLTIAHRTLRPLIVA